MKGIVLAGGNGTRLRPATSIINKHLILVYNKPMIEYPLQTLIDLGCDDIVIVSGGEHIGSFSEYLGDGERYGVAFNYRVQAVAGGIAQALNCAKDFVDVNESQQIIPVILGDNYFDTTPELPTEETIVVSEVEHPERFGVYHEGKIIEKPQTPLSKLAVTGLYFYKPRTIHRTDRVLPSARGEMEITDINNIVLQGIHNVVVYKGYWSDMGTFDSLLGAANHVKNLAV